MLKVSARLLVAAGVQLFFMVGLFRPDWLAGVGLAGDRTQTGAAQAMAVPSVPAIAITIDQVVASGLELPVAVTHAGDGSRRLFIVEQRGRIRIVKNGTLLSTPFLDISGRRAMLRRAGLAQRRFPARLCGEGPLLRQLHPPVGRRHDDRPLRRDRRSRPRRPEQRAGRPARAAAVRQPQRRPARVQPGRRLPVHRHGRRRLRRRPPELRPAHRPAPGQDAAHRRRDRQLQ